MSATPSIPDPRDTQQFLKAVKEIIEVREGRRGKKDSYGRYPERFITAAELEDLLVGSAAIVQAIESVSSSASSSTVDRTIASGIITLTESDAEEYRVTLTSETGTTDQLDRINGLTAGKKVILYAATGHEITIKNGTYLKLQADFTLIDYNTITLRSWGSSICAEESRVDIYDTEAVWGALDDWLAAVSRGHYCDPASTMSERVMYFASRGLVDSIS